MPIAFQFGMKVRKPQRQRANHPSPAPRACGDLTDTRPHPSAYLTRQPIVHNSKTSIGHHIYRATESHAELSKTPTSPTHAFSRDHRRWSIPGGRLGHFRLRELPGRVAPYGPSSPFSKNRPPVQNPTMTPTADVFSTRDGTVQVAARASLPRPKSASGENRPRITRSRPAPTRPRRTPATNYLHAVDRFRRTRC